MTELLDRVLSVATLRTMVRQKCGAGVRGETISRLIAAYVSADVVADSLGESESGRLSVEMIDPDRRVAFLEALQRLPARRPIVRNEAALLRH
jgi:hypothetical protein